MRSKFKLQRNTSATSSVRVRPISRTARVLGIIASLALTTVFTTSRRRKPTALSEAEVRTLTLNLLKNLLPSQRRFAVRLWDGTLLRPAGSLESESLESRELEAATLVLNHPAALGKLLRLPLDLAGGEAYLKGDFDLEGDFSAIFELMDSLHLKLSPLRLAQLVRDATQLRTQAQPDSPESPVPSSGFRHSRKQDLEAISYHYDVSNAFYKLWLDPRMVYSCAYFPTGSETLEQAQTAKLELICRKLRLQPDEKVLDIGCGWGGFALYAAQHYGVCVHGITLSRKQLGEAQTRVRQAGLEGRVTLELRDYRDVQGQFDKISSIGMSEHVGRRNLPEYFRVAQRCLKPGGLMLNHAISEGLQQIKVSKQVVSGQFAARYVFPGGELMSIAETLEAAESAHLEVRDVENLREHYARTLNFWSENLERNQQAALLEVGSEKLRLWRLYMRACIHYFSFGHIAIHQTLLAKPGARNRVALPLSRADLYRT